MKVTMFAAPFGQSGQLHIHCRRYLRLLQLAGCSIASIEHSGATSAPLPGIEQYKYPRRMRRLDGFVTASALSFVHKRRLAPLLKATAADVFHVQWVDERILDVDVAGGHPLIATAWGSDLNVPARAGEKNATRRRIGAALRALELLIVDSEDIIDTARKLAGTEVSTAMLPIGIDTRLFHPELPAERNHWRKRLEIEPDAIVYMAARQLGAVYRPAEIIRAFAAMATSVRNHSYLIIRTFGHSVGTSVTELQQLAQDLKVAARVRWVGGMPYEEQPALFAAADVAVNFPQMDAFPVTMLESLACGLPMLTNRLSAYESNGVQPYLVFTTDDSVPALTASMTGAFENLPGLRNQARLGREHIVKHFDETVSAARLKEIYQSVLQNVRPAVRVKTTPR